MKPRKPLKDLNLMDRFLFAEAMEDPENMKTLLEIILGRDIVLKELPQVEKEGRNSPLYRYVKFDVWAKDEEDTIYDTEVQQRDTKSLPRRSRFYQALLDGRMLEPGEIDFNRLGQVFIIVITSFDLFGRGRYRYTFQMSCGEEPDISLGDGAVRIFLNTEGNRPEEVRPELVELLHYMRDTSEATARSCKSDRIHRLQKRISSIKSNEEVSVKYMQAWEEREWDKRDAREEGARNQLKKLIGKKLQKGLSPEEIAEILEEDLEVITSLIGEMSQDVSEE